MWRICAGVANTRTRTHESHIEEAAFGRLHKGGGLRPPPFVDSSIWVSPWVWVRVFGTPGQRCVVLPMGFSMGTQHWTICHFADGCPHGSEPCTMELPLGTTAFFAYVEGPNSIIVKNQTSVFFLQWLVGVCAGVI